MQRLCAAAAALLWCPAAAIAQTGGDGSGHGSDHGGVQAVFATRAEAEKAAPRFHCSGAHRMGNHWMPCAAHGPAPGPGASTNGGSR